MKNIVLFSTRARMYLTEIPQIILLLIAVRFNDKVDSFLKLYPLIILMCGCIIFTAVYFYRAVTISFEEIRCVGIFSSHDKAIINKDKTLVITLLPKKKLKLELFGDGGDSPTFEWLRSDGPTKINLFREKAYGTKKDVKKLLSYFEIEENDFDKILNGERPENSTLTPNELYKFFEGDYEFVSVSSFAATESTEIHILFKETV